MPQLTLEPRNLLILYKNFHGCKLPGTNNENRKQYHYHLSFYNSHVAIADCHYFISIGQNSHVIILHNGTLMSLLCVKTITLEQRPCVKFRLTQFLYHKYLSICINPPWFNNEMKHAIQVRYRI